MNDKMFRDIDEKKMMQSKATTITAVMDEITKPRFVYRKWFVFPPVIVTAVFLSALLFSNLFTTNDPIQNDPIQNDPIVLTDYSSAKLAEVSYISGSILSSAFANTTTSVPSFMADTTFSTFETNLNEFHTYFDMVKVFLDNVDFEESVLLEVSENPLYTDKITITQDNQTFVLYVVLEEGTLEGILLVDEEEYLVEGDYLQKEERVEISVKATGGSNSIEIDYKVVSKGDTRKTFEIKQDINGTSTEKEIRIDYDNDEVTVEYDENNNSIELVKEVNGTSVTYFLEYDIDDEKGEVVIVPSIRDGKEVYTYIIDQDDYHTEIELDDPDDDDVEEEQHHQGISTKNKISL